MNSLLKCLIVPKFIAFALLNLITFSGNQADEGPNAQVLLEKWDSEMKLEKGTYFLRISKKQGTTTIMEADSTLMVGDEQKRFYFFSKPGEEAHLKFFASNTEKVLAVLKRGSSRIEKLSPMDSVEQTAQGTSFSYYDLSGVQLEANYTVDTVETYESVDKQYWKVHIRPLNKATYGKLLVYLEKETLQPYRIDYFSRTGIMKKILRVRYGKVSVDDQKQKSEKEIVKKLEMTDFENDEKSIIEIESLKINPLPDSELFSIKNLSFLEK
ncbi:MAG: outer membrane lipoprotein-sorting protein [Leptospiraceae bacterium]|nr:outer membrane lipoprotein-sorting protein [Leptospiraceae bacterium]MCP5510653.1 outer membrane lipoprotein-sorting protein [Leptospiraceae bacterium]